MSESSATKNSVRVAGTIIAVAVGVALFSFIEPTKLKDVASELINFFSLIGAMLAQVIALTATMVDLSKFPSKAIVGIKPLIVEFQERSKNLFILICISICALVAVKIYCTELSSPLFLNFNNWYSALVGAFLLLTLRSIIETITIVIALHRKRMDLEETLSKQREDEIERVAVAQVGQLYDALSKEVAERRQRPTTHVTPPT